MAAAMFLVLAFMGAAFSAHVPDHPMYSDVILPPIPSGQNIDVDVCIDPEFKCKWLGRDGSILDSIDDSDKINYVEISATQLVSEYFHQTGAETIQLMARHMPPELFTEMARNCRVGLFTDVDKTTIFPEYEQYRDRPECAGRCDGACSNTCTGDGRKYDDLAGLGGQRGTCLDDNYMCTAKDPYYKSTNILVHEFAHTVHGYALPYVNGDWYNRVWYAYQNARSQAIWDLNSYAMVNEWEYLAEASGVFWNVNHNGDSSGGMSRCGRTDGGYCECPEDGRAYLASKDPELYDILVYMWTNGNGSAKGDLHICMTEPNNDGCDME